MAFVINEVVLSQNLFCMVMPKPHLCFVSMTFMSQRNGENGYPVFFTWMLPE
jgi:hypothetical protein